MKKQQFFDLDEGDRVETYKGKGTVISAISGYTRWSIKVKHDEKGIKKKWFPFEYVKLISKKEK